MRLSQIARILRFLKAAYVVAVLIVVVDESGVIGHQPVIASAADSVHGLRDGEFVGELDEVGEMVDAIGRIADSFNELGRALE